MTMHSTHGLFLGFVVLRYDIRSRLQHAAQNHLIVMGSRQRDSRQHMDNWLLSVTVFVVSLVSDLQQQNMQKDMMMQKTKINLIQLEAFYKKKLVLLYPQVRVRIKLRINPKKIKPVSTRSQACIQVASYPQPLSLSLSIYIQCHYNIYIYIYICDARGTTLN